MKVQGDHDNSSRGEHECMRQIPWQLSGTKQERLKNTRCKCPKEYLFINSTRRNNIQSIFVQVQKLGK